MKTTTVYKVVTVKETTKGGKFLSFLARIRKSKFTREYKIGRWTRPRIGQLFAFKTLHDAVSYFGIRYDRAILECEATDVTVLGAYTQIPYVKYGDFCGKIDIMDRLLVDFWIDTLESSHNKLVENYTPLLTIIPELILQQPPTGTVVCSAIRPTRVLWNRGEKVVVEPSLSTQTGIGTQPA